MTISCYIVDTGGHLEIFCAVPKMYENSELYLNRQCFWNEAVAMACFYVQGWRAHSTSFAALILFLRLLNYVICLFVCVCVCVCVCVSGTRLRVCVCTCVLGALRWIS